MPEASLDIKRYYCNEEPKKVLALHLAVFDRTAQLEEKILLLEEAEETGFMLGEQKGFEMAKEKIESLKKEIESREPKIKSTETKLNLAEKERDAAEKRLENSMHHINELRGVLLEAVKRFINRGN